jgi:AcrR family transcriptional regulator
MKHDSPPPDVYAVNMPWDGNSVNIGQDEVVTPTGSTQRDRYHHGDLANALTDAATDLARRGGPEAVVLREAARQVGVSATAAYRHFAGHPDLIHAVKERAQAALTDRMQAEVAASAAVPDPGEDALRRLRAIGIAYVRFALAEPGLFRTAFCRADGPQVQQMELANFRAYQLLSEVIDQLAAAGLVDPARRPYAETAAWSGMHGLALLLLDGPLARLTGADRDVVIAGTADVLIAGLGR